MIQVRSCGSVLSVAVSQRDLLQRRGGSLSGLDGGVAAESRRKKFLIWVIDRNVMGNALGHVAVFISIINNM